MATTQTSTAKSKEDERAYALAHDKSKTIGERKIGRQAPDLTDKIVIPKGKLLKWLLGL